MDLGCDHESGLRVGCWIQGPLYLKFLTQKHPTLSGVCVPPLLDESTHPLPGAGPPPLLHGVGAASYVHIADSAAPAPYSGPLPANPAPPPDHTNPLSVVQARQAAC